MRCSLAIIGRVTCPRCGRRTQEIEENGVHLDFCAGCKGTWLDKDEAVAFANEDVRARNVSEALFESTLLGASRSSMRCPRCGGDMTEGGLFASDYRIDRCDACGGIWFDKRELTRLRDLQAPRAPPPGTKASRPKASRSPARDAERAPRRRRAGEDPAFAAIVAELERLGRTMRPSREPHCPKCNRGPSIKDLWQCTCGWVWNVFRTGARCPSCNHQWRETRCPACATWSPHALWYAA